MQGSKDYLKVEYMEIRDCLDPECFLSSKAFVIGMNLAKSKFPAVSSHRCILFWVVLKICTDCFLEVYIRILWIDFCFDLESFGPRLFARLNWMLTQAGRQFLEPGSHAALVVSSPQFVIARYVPGPESSRRTKCADGLKCGGEEEGNESTSKEFYLGGGGSGKTPGNRQRAQAQGYKLRRKFELSRPCSLCINIVHELFPGRHRV